MPQKRAACPPARPPLRRASPGPGSTAVTLRSTPACTDIYRHWSSRAAAAAATRTWHRARLPHNVAARRLGRLCRLVHVLRGSANTASDAAPVDVSVRLFSIHSLPNGSSAQPPQQPLV